MFRVRCFTIQLIQSNSLLLTTLTLFRCLAVTGYWHASSTRSCIADIKDISKSQKQGACSQKLVIAGRLGWPDGEKETLDAIKQLKLTENVELLGAYTQDQAPAIYQGEISVYIVSY